MKTIYTSLPIYDRLTKQCFLRGRKGGFDSPVPIMCPRHRLPSFQWNAESDNMGDVTSIELIDTDTNQYNRPLGLLGWTNVSYDTLTTSGLNITNGVNAVGGAAAQITQTFNVQTGETLRFYGVFAHTGITQAFEIYLDSGGGSVIVDSTQLADGSNTITYTFAADGVCTLILNQTAALGASTFSLIGVIINTDWINSLFVTLPAASVTTDTYYTYSGDTLNYLLPTGTYYLRITMENGHVLYSDWFRIDCIYENLITAFTNITYETLITSGTRILSMVNSAASGWCLSDSFEVIKGEKIKVVFYLTKTSGTLPSIILINTGWTLEDSETLTEGLNEIELTSTWAGDAYLIFENNASNVNMQTSEIWVFRNYSEKYLTINYSNTCDLGDILYQDGLTQSIWFESDAIEMFFLHDEEGVKNGDGRFVKTFARQVKKYIAKTKEMPGFMVEVFNRMKLHDTIELIDLVGNVNDVYNLEVVHEWLFDDKYYAKIDLTFDYEEAFVVAGCCNNIN